MLHVHEAVGWQGHVTVTARQPDGSLTVERFRNLITNAGLNLLRDALGGYATDGQIKYVALGSGATAPAASDTGLALEEFRKAVTSQSAPATGELLTRLYVAPDEATTFTIRELGWFAGPAATSTPGSGVLVARVLYERTKTSLESLQIDRTDTLGRS